MIVPGKSEEEKHESQRHEEPGSEGKPHPGSEMLDASKLEPQEKGKSIDSQGECEEREYPVDPLAPAKQPGDNREQGAQNPRDQHGDV